MTDIDVRAEGLDYVKSTNSNNETETQVIPSTFNSPQQESLQNLVPTVDDNESKRSNIEGPGHPSSGESSVSSPTKGPKQTFRDFLSCSVPSFSLSPSRPFSPPKSHSDDEGRKDTRLTHRRSKKSCIKRMRQKYNAEKQPGPENLAKCSCNSCWAENILAIASDAVTPNVPDRYTPSRTADKCQRIRRARRITLSNIQKTLTYDVNTGKVFDITTEEPDFTGEEKEVGEMYTWSGENEEEEEQNDDRDEEKCGQLDDNELECLHEMDILKEERSEKPEVDQQSHDIEVFEDEDQQPSTHSDLA